MAESRSYSNGYQYASYTASDTSTSGSNEFSRLSQVIGTDVQKVSQNVASMQKMVSQLGTSQDSESLRSQLHQVQHYTNQLVKDTNNHLKELSQVPSPANSSDQRERKILKEKLAGQFSDALKSFQDAQRIAAQKERESVIRARANSGYGVSPFENDTVASNLIDLASPTQGQTTQGQMMTSLQMEEEVNLELLREREETVRKLEADIVGVNEIFKDLATFVHEQQELVDSIEANVEQTQIQVSEGTQQLSKASEYKSKARRKMVCLIITGIAVLAVVITLIVVFTK